MKYLLLSLLFIPNLAFATPYDVVKDQSEIQFSGTHAGNDFTGVFEDWDATIDFDKDDLSTSSAVINFDLRNAKTGNKLYDGTLPNEDWFDVSNHPQGMFELTSIEETDTGYKAKGDLTLKDITKPVSFDFKLEGDNPIVMTAEFPINRLNYNIGTDSDPDAEWVSEQIMITINLHATTQ